MRGVAATVEHDNALQKFNFSTVIDAGANKGQFTAYAQWRWPTARIVCFEPLDKPRATLAAIASEQTEIHACALGVETGKASMHVASRTDSSSLLPLAERQKTIFKMDKVADLMVPVRRLDQCVAADLSRPSLLKLDVQGFELEVLKGSSELLPAIDVVYVEVSWIELYRGQALHDEVDALLADTGFERFECYNIFAHEGRTVQADSLYLRQS